MVYGKEIGLQRLSTKNASAVHVSAKAAVIAVLASTVAACSSMPSLYDGENIHVKARTTVLEQDVAVVSEDYRTLIERYKALEKLYVDLAAERDSQSRAIASLEEKVANAARAQELRTSLNSVSGEVGELRTKLEGLEDRLFSVEVSSPGTNRLDDDATAQAIMGDSPVDSVSDATLADADESEAEEGAQPGDNTQIQDAAEEEPSFGVHIASYRTNDQVPGGWAGLQTRFADMLVDLTPLIYTQTQAGVGQFLRLIVGPVATQQDAEDICAAIRDVDTDQYCRVTDYQGDPLDF